MKVVSSLKSLKKRDLNNKYKRKGKLYVINKKTKNEIKTRLMDIKDQKETWSGFTKLATIGNNNCYNFSDDGLFFSIDIV